MADMIGPFKHQKVANEACEAINSTRPNDSEVLPPGRWFVFDSHGYWLRWAPPGPYNEPFRNSTIVPELWDFFMAQRVS